MAGRGCLVFGGVGIANGGGRDCAIGGVVGLGVTGVGRGGVLLFGAVRGVGAVFASVVVGVSADTLVSMSGALGAAGSGGVYAMSGRSRCIGWVVSVGNGVYRRRYRLFLVVSRPEPSVLMAYWWY